MRFATGRIAVTVLVAGSFGWLAAPGASAAEGGDPPSPAQQAAQSRVMGDKLAVKASADRLLGRRTPATRPGATTVSAAAAKRFPTTATAWLNPTIFGQQYNWTCGPASMRNMVYGMTKGSVNHPESWYRKQLGTKNDGNGTDNSWIVREMNQHFSSYGHWAYYKPTSTQDLLTTVAADVSYRIPQTTYLNVTTRYLPIYRGQDLKHWMLAFNYHLGKKTISTADPNRYNWDAWGRQWNIPASKVYNAVHYSPSRGVVW
ncbi:hypothetical protein [Intrasporangium sp.]|uniref:hypothetical protein n=1 Tax=Intrasporangium sp. TaxID=1925024 RepID=UPI003221F631